MKNPEPYQMSKLDEYRLWVAIHDQEFNVVPTRNYETRPAKPSVETKNSADEKSG